MEYRIGSKRDLKSIDQLPPKLAKNDRVILDAGQQSIANRGFEAPAGVQIFSDGKGRHEIKSNLRAFPLIKFRGDDFSLVSVNFDTRAHAIDVKGCAGKIAKSSQSGAGGLIKMYDALNLKISEIMHKTSRRRDAVIYAGGTEAVGNRNIEVMDMTIVAAADDPDDDDDGQVTHGTRWHETRGLTMKRADIDGRRGRNPFNFRDRAKFLLEDSRVIGGISVFGPLGDGDGMSKPGWECTRLDGLTVRRVKFENARVTLEAGLLNALFEKCWFSHPTHSLINVEGPYGPRPPASAHFVDCDFDSDRDPFTGFPGRYKALKFTNCRHKGKPYTAPQ